MQVTLNKEATEKLDDLILCRQLDSCVQLLDEDTSREITVIFHSQQLRRKSQNLLHNGDNVVQQYT
jgi:hypothetical protein